MKVVSVINYKGGVGKTTLTANLGAYAASNGRRVLMIDLDPQASLTFSFLTPEYWGMKYSDNKTMKNYFEPVIKKYAGKPDLRNLILPINMGNIMNFDGMKFDIICSSLKLIDIDVKLSLLINVTYPEIWASSFLSVCSYLHNSLSEIQDDYDLVLIDCPPNTNIVVKNALLASDYYIVPAKMDYLSTMGIQQLIDGVNEYIEEYCRHMNTLNNPPEYIQPSIKLLGIVPMMVTILKDRNGYKDITATQHDFMTGLEHKGFKIFPLVRNNGTVFGSAPVDGIPVVLTHPKFYQTTHRKIISELEELGEEFLAGIGL